MPERLEAVGNPVVVTAPSSNATAHGQADRVQPADEVDHARRRRAGVPATRAERNPRPQLVLSVGGGGGTPGPTRRARAPAGSAASRPIGRASSWRPSGATQLRIQPRDQYKEISFTGGVELKSPGVGQLQAKKIFVWLTETPSPTDDKKFDLQPHGLSASEDVRFGSSRLSGKVDELEVWFEQEVRDQGLAAASDAACQQGWEGWAVHRPLEHAAQRDGVDGSEVRRLPADRPAAFRGHRPPASRPRLVRNGGSGADRSDD